MTHTPAPWQLISCNGKDHSAIATIEPAPETMVGPNYWTVASVNTRRDGWEANARLIAAAPDLLAALREAIVWWDDRKPDYEPTGVDPIAPWRAALKKATTP